MNLFRLQPTRPKRSRSTPPRRRPHSRLWVERLEDRSVPTTFTWLGANNGDWNLPANWDQPTAPTTGSDVVINNGTTPAYNTTVEINALTIGSTSGLNLGSGTLTTDGTFNNAGNVVIGAGSTVKITSGGTSTGDWDIAATGSLLFTGTYLLDNGTDITGAGFATVGANPGSPSGTLNVGDAASDVVNASNIAICDPASFTAGTLVATGALSISGQLIEGAGNFASGMLSGTGNVTIGGLFTWNNGEMKGTGQTFANGGLRIAATSSAVLEDGRHLDNNGTAIWPAGAGNITLQNGAVFNNNGTFDAQVNLTIADGGGAAVSAFNNNKVNNVPAVFKKTAGANNFGAATHIQVPFNNDGTVDVQIGNATFASGGTSTGPWTVAAAATLDFIGGTWNLNAGSTVTGSIVRFLGGTVNLADAYSVDNTVVGGTFGVAFGGGTVNFNATSDTSTLELDGFFGGVLGGLGNVTITGLFTWNGGLMTGSGTTFANGGIAWSGGDLDGRRLENPGTTTWTSGSIGFNHGAVFDNNGTFDARTDSGISDAATFGGGALSVFNNNGTFKKSVGTGTTTIGAQFTKGGTIDEQTGTLSLTGGLTNFPIASTAGISSSPVGATESGTTVTITTSGHEPVVVGQTVTISGVDEAGYNGTFVVTAVPSVTTFQYTAPTSGLPNSGNGTATFLSTATLTGGTYLVSGTLQVHGADIVTNAATVVLNGPGSAFLNQSTGNDSLANFATNTLGGSFTIQNGRNFTLPGVGRVLDAFNPASLGQIVGVAFDPATGHVFVYASFDANITELSPTGDVVGTIPRPGNSSNDFDLDFLPEAITVGGTTVPAGSLIAENGDDSPDTIYYLDKTTGAVLASVTLSQAGGDNSNGVAYSLQRHTIFTEDFANDRIREINPATGADINSFPVAPGGSPSFDLFFADLEVSQATGNIFLVSSSQNRIREMTPDGAFVRDLDVTILSLGGMTGITFDDAAEETWITNSSGAVFHLSEFAFFNSDSVTVGSGSTLTVGGGTKYIQSAGTTTLNGTLGGRRVTLTGGVLTGAGTVNADLANAAVIAPGQQLGTLHVAGNYTQTGAGILKLEIGGTNAATPDFDRLDVGGAATLGGTLNVSLVNGFTPAGADAFLVIPFVSRTGDFATFNGSSFPGGIFTRLFHPTDLTLDVNVAPTALDDSDTTLEDQARTINVLGNDSDGDGDPITITAITQPAHGAAVNNGGNLTYTPAADFNGSDTFAYTVSDPLGLSATATVRVTVTPVNDAPALDPIANPPAVDEESGAHTVTVAGVGPGGGADEAGQTVTLTATSSNPAVVPNPVITGNGATRTLTYQPAANANGTVTITVTATDSGGTSNGGVDAFQRTFTVTVNAVNDPPAFDAIADPPAVNEDSGSHTVTVTGVGPGGGADEAGQTVTLTATSSNPAVVPNPTISGTGASRTLTYQPAPDANGSVTITVTATDNGGTANGGVNTSIPRTFVITINPVNDAPTFTASNPPAVNEDAGPQTVASWATFNPGPANESNQAVQGYTVTGVSNPGLFAAPPSVANDGTLRYTPAANAFGTSAFTVTVRDSGGTANGGVDTSLPQTFTVAVNSVNHLPTISDIPDQGTPVNTPTAAIPFTIGDVETPPASLSVSATSGNPALVPVGNIVFGGSGASRTVTVTPAADQTGTARITITVTDADNGAASDSFLLTVTAAGNSPPAISDILDVTINEDTASGVLRFTLSDAETPAAALTVLGSSSNPALVPDANIVFGGSGANRTVTVIPAGDQFGTATIQVTVRDGNGATASDTFLLTVSAVNDPPTFTAGNPPTVNEDAGPQTVANWATFSPGPANESSQTVLGYTVTGVSNPTLFAVTPSVANDGTLTYTPAANASGTSLFTVTVRDSGGTANGGNDTSLSQTFTITVNAVNDPPFFDAVSSQTVNEDAAAQAVSITNVGPGGAADEAGQAVTLTAVSSNPAVVPNPTVTGAGATRTLSYAPAPNDSGLVTITVTANDGQSQNNTSQRTFTITVNPVNDPPAFDTIADQFVPQNSPAQTVSVTNLGPGGGSDESGQTVTMSATSDNPGLVPNPTFTGTGGKRTLTYAPVAGTTGTAVITVTADDGQAQNRFFTRTFSVFVTAAGNQPPVVVHPIADLTVNEDAAPVLHYADLNTVFDDPSDPDSALTYTVAANTPSGIVTAVIQPGGTLDLGFVADQHGVVDITVRATDPGNLSAQDTFRVTVNAANAVIQFIATTFSAAEDGGNAAITVTRGGNPANAVTVQFFTADGTSQAGSDYTAVSQTLTFTAGQTSQTVTVPVLDDMIFEGDETIHVTLSNPGAGATLGSPATALLTIQDNDAPADTGTFQFQDAEVTASESAAVTLTVTRTGSAAGSATLQLTTHDGDGPLGAVAGQDYTATSVTLTFAPGETRKTVSIPVLNDGLVEARETFTVVLSNPSAGATLGSPARAAVTLHSDDGTPSQRYAVQLYADVLGRPADDAGLAFWSAVLDQGAPRPDVARGFWESPEHRGQEVDQYYATFLARAADAAGRAFWVGHFLAGASEFDVQRGFVTSDEFQRHFPSPLDYVKGLYALILGRDVDPTGLAVWPPVAEQLDGRDAVARGIFTSAEDERLLIDQFYAEFLHRGPDAAGEQTWLAILQDELLSLSRVVEGFLASEEYLGLQG